MYTIEARRSEIADMPAVLRHMAFAEVFSYIPQPTTSATKDNAHIFGMSPEEVLDSYIKFGKSGKKLLGDDFTMGVDSHVKTDIGVRERSRRERSRGRESWLGIIHAFFEAEPVHTTSEFRRHFAQFMGNTYVKGVTRDSETGLPNTAEIPFYTEIFERGFNPFTPEGASHIEQVVFVAAYHQDCSQRGLLNAVFGNREDTVSTDLLAWNASFRELHGSTTLSIDRTAPVNVSGHERKPGKNQSRFLPTLKDDEIGLFGLVASRRELIQPPVRK